MSSPSYWTIVYGGLEKSLAEWGVDHASMTRTLRSQATDTLAFKTTGLALDAAETFSNNSTVIVKRNGVGWFYGRVTRVNKFGAANNESVDYELSGPWWYFENRPMEQLWNIANNPTIKTSTVSPQYRGRHLIGWNNSGVKESTAQIITRAVGYAQARGAPVVMGTAGGAYDIPVSEHTDLTVAELIRMMLKWMPDAVTWFDYRGSIPIFNVIRGGSAGNISLPVFDSPNESLDISSRNDLQSPGVVIYYEQQNSINEVTWSTITREQAGSDTFGTLIYTVQIGGSVKTFQSQQVTILGVDVTTQAFWESLLPWLHQASSVTIEDVRINNALASGQSADASDGTSGYTGLGLTDFSGAVSAPPSTSSLLNVLADGQVPSWLTSHFFDAVITAKISYTLQNPDTLAQEVKVKVPFTAKCKGTDLNNSPSPQTFEQVTSFTPAEPVPSGLAANLYSSVSYLHYEGEFTLVEDEITDQLAMGSVLNLTGGRSEWTNMRALIQEIHNDVGQGRTTARFGPPGHLTPQDILELMRVQRNRPTSYRLQEMVTGVFYGTGAQVGGAFQVSQNNSAPSHQPGKEITLADTPATNPTKVVLKTDDLKALLIALGLDPLTTPDPDLKLRSIDICMDDPDNPGTQVAGKMGVLATKPVKNP